MAEPYSVDLDELDDIVAQMSRFDSDAEHLCAEVDALVARLHVTWTGEGADAQQKAHERWQRGATRMREALADLHSTAQVAHTNYTAAVRANVGMWPT
ncbi:WXG100 family type VII secretion target [Speluncibacter jeojiensis]|uniref:ESAT-6-like protein n=1 Tax=Speluncibacter jeojiensis TaxID=2710754 RepID=A0A9X4M0Q3_9ACTN|nr:WXG100 family type VII secretion target [Corynebacteriales bacterium D3-21]